MSYPYTRPPRPIIPPYTRPVIPRPPRPVIPPHTRPTRPTYTRPARPVRPSLQQYCGQLRQLIAKYPAYRDRLIQRFASHGIICSGYSGGSSSSSYYASPEAPPQVLPAFGELTAEDSILKRL